MKNQELDIVSLRIIKLYFLGIRALNFPGYNKKFQQKDMELFIQLADIMENLSNLDEQLIYELKLLKDYLFSIENEKYSLTVHRMLLDMKEEFEKII
ncbi:hypothetical protein [Enterococcus faecalis]|uniref:hypothetical protein n=1 Tax=Enterococcus faecalis TaxID=1351 RepID=UPI00080C5ECB|nr:hypothetical protein [Enterococcus faecalis]ANU71936.1 hypothetical protein A4V06_02175 [Enterococcus faecalis]ASU26635.1 hypothetical protein ADH73_11500 [Enterococcus faecalis]MCO8259823.1 hypothetical protein [Enterococcus faecalis]MCP8907842.1 hypothetical protein [Enterococcus faecalis]MCP8910888.1 hypothetical protein [Enterococcus faecalis]